MISNDSDAERLSQFESLLVNPQYAKDIKGMRILLYKDVFNRGNLSEAARNLLLFLGAAEVDVVACFSAGQAHRSAIYSLKPELKGTAEELLTNESRMTKDLFILQDSEYFMKRMLMWGDQKWSLRKWHDSMYLFIEDFFPEFVPNDIPWAYNPLHQ